MPRVTNARNEYGEPRVATSETHHFPRSTSTHTYEAVLNIAPIARPQLSLPSILLAPGSGNAVLLLDNGNIEYLRWVLDKSETAINSWNDRFNGATT